MSDFLKYQHLERFGNTAVQGVEEGTCWVFPKLDGTNASVWCDAEGNIKAGSRNRELSLDNDNAGFYVWVRRNEDLFENFFCHPLCKKYTIYGEWLVPHSLKTYREDAWRDFYIFDVVDRENRLSIPYPKLNSLLPEKLLDKVIPPLAVVTDGDKNVFQKILEQNTYLIQEGKGIGEGIVIKNYDYINRFGRQVWAKMVSNEFKEKHVKTMGVKVLQGKPKVEKEVVEKFLTEALVLKTRSKIELEEGEWSNRLIPRLLGTVWYDFINEELFDILKKYKNPTLDFKELKKYVDNQTKRIIEL